MGTRFTKRASAMLAAVKAGLQNRGQAGVTASLQRRTSVTPIETLESRRLFTTTVAVNTFLDSLISISSVQSIRKVLIEEAGVSGGLVVQIPAGTYTLTQGELEVGPSISSVTFQAIGGQAVISGGNTNRVFNIAQGAVVTMNSVTVENGQIAQLQGNASVSDSQGAGIYNAGTLTLNSSSVLNNFFTTSAESDIIKAGGAGIANVGTMTLLNSTVSGNGAKTAAPDAESTEVDGSGIYNDGTMTISKSTVSGNTLGFGAIDNEAVMTVGSSSNISNNSSIAVGGAFENGISATLTVTDTLISDNKTPDYGAGIFNQGAVTLNRVTLANNSAVYSAQQNEGAQIGGAIVNGFSSGPLTVSNSTIIGNTAAAAGGGIYVSSGTVTLTNDTITGNSTTDNQNLSQTGEGGGGIFVAAGTVLIGNTVVAQNTQISTTDGSVTPSDVGGTVTDKGNNMIGATDGSTGITASSDSVGSAASPLNPELSAPTGAMLVEVPIGENQDDGPGENPSSPLIDQGNNALVTSSTDGRGLTRTVNGTVDIGAVETQLTVTTAAPNQNVYSGVASTISLGSFSDAGTTGPYNIFVDWAQDSAPIVSVNVNSTGAVTATATFLGEPDITSFTGDVQITDSLGTVLVANTSFNISVVSKPVGPPQLTGTTIGTAGSYGNSGNTIAKATDGNLSTFYDGATNGSSSSTDNWVGIDLGSTGGKVTQVLYAPRSGYAGRMLGGSIQASNSANFSAGVVTLYTISGTPVTGSLTTTTITNTTAYRYYRYLSPNNSYGDIAEIQFFGTAGGLTGATKLTGTTIGTSGSYGNSGNTIAKATDGNLSTFFDGATAGTSASTDNWVGLDFGSTGGKVTQVEYAPRSSYASRMVGGTIQASNSSNFTSGVVTLSTITATPVTGSLTTATFTNTTAYRYYRYLSPNGSFGDVAEIQFFGTAGGLSGPPLLTGTTIGTSGSYGNSGNTIAKATDGNLSTFFDGATAGTSASTDNWVGLDLGTAQIATEVQYAPRSSFASRMVGGTIQASNSAIFSTGVVTLYTITATPASGSLTTAVFSNSTAYRYYRYLSPNGSFGDISEISFYGPSAV